MAAYGAADETKKDIVTKPQAVDRISVFELCDLCHVKMGFGILFLDTSPHTAVPT